MQARMKTAGAAFAAAALLSCPWVADADSWARPRVKEVFSESREYFVRVTPGEEKRHATAEFYRRAPDRSYRLVAEARLANPVAPVEFFVANSGHLATLDNWHNVGYGKVVALYDARGKPIRAYELRELFEAKEIERLPHSTSSIHWRKGAFYLRQDQSTLLVTVKDGADFLFGLESGGFEYCEYHEKSFRCRADLRGWTHSRRGLER